MKKYQLSSSNGTQPRDPSSLSLLPTEKNEFLATNSPFSVTPQFRWFVLMIQKIKLRLANGRRTSQLEGAILMKKKNRLHTYI